MNGHRTVEWQSVESGPTKKRSTPKRMTTPFLPKLVTGHLFLLVFHHELVPRKLVQTSWRLLNIEGLAKPKLLDGGTKRLDPSCPVLHFVPFCWEGSPLNSTNQKRVPFFPMATGHLRDWGEANLKCSGSQPLQGSQALGWLSYQIQAAFQREATFEGIQPLVKWNTTGNQASDFRT